MLIITIVIFMFFQSLTCSAQELDQFQNIQIDPKFKVAIESDPFLMTGMLDVKEIDGKQYIISVGVTENENAGEDTARTRLKMTKIAILKAEAEIAKFIQTEVSTETSLEKRTEKTTEIEQEREKREVRVQKILREITTTRAHEILRLVERIGSWYSEDMEFYYAAVAMPIND